MINKVAEFTTQYIDTDDEEYSEYRRNGPEGWEMRMGESWEPVFCPRQDELEAAYQEFVSSQLELARRFRALRLFLDKWYPDVMNTEEPTLAQRLRALGLTEEQITGVFEAIDEIEVSLPKGPG